MYGDSAAAFCGALIESVSAIGSALFAAFGIVIARLVLRIRWLAIGVTMLFLSLTAVYDMSAKPYSLVFPLTSGALLTLVAMRFGLLSLVVAWFTWGMLAAVPMTLEFSHWRAIPSNWTLAMFVCLALFGFYASRAGLWPAPGIESDSQSQALSRVARLDDCGSLSILPRGARPPAFCRHPVSSCPLCPRVSVVIRASVISVLSVKRTMIE
jgi:hypothetical protein